MLFKIAGMSAGDCVKTGHIPNSAATSDDYRDTSVRVFFRLCNHQTHDSQSQRKIAVADYGFD